MDHFTKEKNIIEFFQLEDSTSIFFPVFNSELRLLFSSIYKKKNWKKWIDSSGKNAPPPDFFNKDLQFMMDVMRIDDHEYISPKGKVVNEERKLESQAFADIKKDEQFKDFQPSQIFVDIHSDLPTDEDHNFTRYKKSFWRTIENHKKKIPNYKIILDIKSYSLFLMNLQLIAKPSKNIQEKRKKESYLKVDRTYLLLIKNF